MRRRSLIAGTAAALAMPRIGRGAVSEVLRFIPQADLAVLDPVWTTTYQTRDHGFLVFDTLFGVDSNFTAQPQMAESAVTEDSGKRWRITLRPGLLFHDGTKVLGRDCAASIRRWGARDGFGQALMAATDEISAPDDRTVEIRLRHPFPLLPDALAKTPPCMCPIMPERLSVTDPFKQVSEMVGSGPYRYKADERVSGSLVVYERNAAYVPRPSGAASGTAGPKRAYFERIEWHIIPDPSTAAASLQRGEIDWWLAPDADLLPMLRKQASLRTENTVPTGFIATLRFNHLIPPFDNPAIRRAMLGGVQQSDYMIGMVGTDPTLWHVPCGVFCPGTPLANDAGMGVLTSKRDLAKVKRDLASAGYGGEPVVLMAPSDIASAKALADISNDWMRKAGLNIEYQAMDWATLVQRRAKIDPVAQGGWNIFHTSWSGLDQMTPAGHIFLRGNGRAAAPGWPSSPKIEASRDAWFQAPDLATQKTLAEQMQLQVFQDVPYVPLGQYFMPTTYQKNLTGLLSGNPVFWNIRREG
ncbi:MAG TPA: ABC transporter substrate-binding protein [Acetobacteraceae bacterium]|jgi:peptide/nickel transport system substrate-binding protein|nr:ABC transporter substrate-binding protein [Acetobacteraceae bacterium]